MTVFFTLELWHSPAGMSQPAGTSTLTKLFFFFFFWLHLRPWFVLKKGEAGVLLCKWAADFALSKDFLSVCGWCYIQIMLFLETQWRQTPPQHEWQIISHPLQCFHGYADMRNKTCPGGFNFAVVDLGEGRRFYWKKRNQVVLCLL